MTTPAEDRKYLETALPELKNYLLSDTLFYPLLQHPMPRLTLGGLLLAQRRLHAYEDASPLDFQLDALRNKWRAAWEQKAATELDSRIRLWSNYLNEYRYTPELSDYYAHEVRLRVMIGLLIAEFGDTDPGELMDLDQLLRSKFRNGEFVWDEALTREFSRDDFWFLYGSLQ